MALMCLGFLSLTAQNEIDAMRYSWNSLGGTARAMSMGGAFSAAGADFSAARLNPAGLGLYRRGDFMLTTRFDLANSNLGYAGRNSTDLASGFSLSNLGYVYAGSLGDGNDAPGLKSFSFAAGYNQIDNYRQNQSISVFNDRSSLTEFFADQANGFSAADLNQSNSYAGLGYAAFLINEDSPGVWKPSVPGGNIQQSLNTIETGRRNEWTLGIAGNFEDFLYMGISVALQDIKYSYEMSFVESDINNLHQVDVLPDSTAFQQLTFYDYYQTKGNGINGKLGIILRPIDFFRFGISVETPTVLSLDDDYYATATGKFDGDPTTYQMNDSDNPEGTFSYRLTTPFKASAGAMVMLQKMGFITADLEFIDYSSARYSGDNSPNTGFVDFTDQNQSIRDLFDYGYNLRFGGEYRYSVLRARLGFAQHGAVMKKDGLSYIDWDSGETLSVRGNRRFYTGGFGIKADSYYLDFAYVRENRETRQLLYSASDPAYEDPELITKKTLNTVLLTIGFTF